MQTLLVQHNVSGAIALSTRGAYHNAHAGNRETLALCQKTNGLLLPAAVLDPRLPNPHQSVSGAKVFCLLPATQNWPMNYAPLSDLLQTLMQMGGENTAKIPVWWEASRIGDATQIAQILKETGYPAPIILGGVRSDTLVEAIAVARKNEKLYLSTSRLRGIGEVEMIAASVGASRVVFASAAPARSLGAGLGLIEQADLAEEDCDRIMGGNALRLLG